jgi:hypothetical protein
MPNAKWNSDANYCKISVDVVEFYIILCASHQHLNLQHNLLTTTRTWQGLLPDRRPGLYMYT